MQGLKEVVRRRTRRMYVCPSRFKCLPKMCAQTYWAVCLKCAPKQWACLPKKCAQMSRCLPKLAPRNILVSAQYVRPKILGAQNDAQHVRPKIFGCLPKNGAQKYLSKTVQNYFVLLLSHQLVK